MGQVWLQVILPVTFGAFLLSLDSVFKRFGLKNGGITPLQLLIIQYALVTLMFGLFYLSRWGMTLPYLLPGFWRAVLCGAVINVALFYFSAKVASLDKGEVSFTAPLQAMTPGLITLLAVTLGEFPGKIGCLGVFLMMCGSYVLLYEKSPERWFDYFGPIKRLRLLLRLKHLSPDERGKTIVVCIALGSAFLGTFGLLMDGLMVRRGINLQGLILALMTITAIFFAAYSLWYLVYPDIRGAQEAKNLLSLLLNQKYLLIISVLAILWVVRIPLMNQAYNSAFVAYVATLKRSQILFSVFLGHFLFKEGDFKKRMWATVLIISGILLISTDSLPLRLSAKIESLGF